jgi:hypothetical protein
MIKKVLIMLGYSIVLTILIVVLLIVSKELLLDHIVHLIMRIRGTAEFEGEEKGREVWNIVAGMIVPSIFLLILTIFLFFNRNKIKNR